MSTKTLHLRLAAGALALGALAIFGDPGRGNVVRLDAKELATIVEGRVDHVTAQELASWIIEGRTDYRIVDIRDAKAYAEYHVPTAENVPIADLPDYPLARNERIVLYSDGGIHAAQAWFLLTAKGYRGATTLLGGLDAWKDEVLFPTPPAGIEGGEAVAAGDAQVEFARAVEVSRFFGGTPRRTADAAAGGEAMALPTPKPKLDMPPPTAARTKKKRKEGC